MKVLIIEDEREVADSLIAAATSLGIEIEAVLAEARDEALEQVRAVSHFDLIVADLKIPSSRGALDASPEFGREVYATARKERPGTPIWVFSGFADEDFLEAIIEEARQGDPFGSGVTQAMIRSFRKLHLHRLLDELAAAQPHLERLDGIELSTGGEDLGLTEEESRLLRLLAQKSHGTTARITAITTGLSSSRTLHLWVVDQHGAQVAETVVKIGPRADLEEEARRYEDNVPMALSATCFAPVWTVITDGVGRAVALAYTVAVPNPRSLGDLLAENEGSAVNVLTRLQDAEGAWYAAGHIEQLTVAELCVLLSAPDVSDVAWGPDAPNVADLAERAVQVRRAPQHGDLHIGNVLVDAAGDPVLIDYGRTGPRVAAYDPVTVELCFAFHPDGRVLANGWPSVDQARSFDRLDDYLAGCPYPEFVRSCRTWAHEVANGDREVWSAILGFVLRQLPYEDTSDELALAYARRASELILA